MHRVYISGPMRNYPDYNYPAFMEMEEWLRQRDDVADVWNPARNDTWDRTEDGPTRSRNLDLALVLNWATMVVVLSGWEDSKGACAEVFAARWAEVPIMTGQYVGTALPDLMEIDPDEIEVDW